MGAFKDAKLCAEFSWTGFVEIYTTESTLHALFLSVEWEVFILSSRGALIIVTF